MAKQVWQETWVRFVEKTGGNSITIEGDQAQIPIARCGFGPEQIERANLAAAAPEMARMLIDSEYDCEGICERCGNCEEGYGKLGSKNYYAPGEHQPACQWLKVMKKIGYR